MGPITGEAAFIGKEQLGFARYAVRQLGGGRVKLAEADTQLVPARAAAVARELHADPRVLAVVGPAGSQEVLAAGSVFRQPDRLPFVSGSATRAALTNGAIPNFFRVAPKDSSQAPVIARYVRRALKAKRVLIADDRSPTSRRLANGVQASLRAGGVDVTRTSVRSSAAEFSAVVATIGPGVDVVFLPWQVAANAQSFGRELKRQGKQAIIFGSDGLDSGDFTIAGAYVASFAPDVRQIPVAAAFVRGYGAPFVSNFGPPTYVAAQAAIRAVRQACADGVATRAEVQKNLRATSIARTVLGRGLAFSALGDAKGAKYSIFRLETGGRKTLVRS